MMTLGLVLSAYPSEAAVNWEPLARTARHDVACDGGSIHMTPLGRLAVWLRFTPRDEAARRQAALEYGQKGYRLHFEYYEIDCSEQTSRLGLIDIIGSSGKRLNRMKGGESLEVIEPGSALDLAAQKICPVLEDAVDDSLDPATPESAAGQDKVPEQLRTRIDAALLAVEAAPDSPAAWRDLGNAYFDADLPLESVTAYDRVLAFAPDDPDVLNDQGAMYRQLGKIDKALANFEKAVRLAPYNLESLYNLGYLYAYDLNNPVRAREVWKRYLLLDGTSDTARQLQEFISRLGD